MTEMSLEPSEVVDGGMVLRALVKGITLFVLVNIGYGLFQPVQNDLLPTLYNGLVPGRERFEEKYEFFLERMLDDHEIRQATPDTYNIVFLGSSELWGNATQARDAIPALIGRNNLTASDGRAVRTYNIGFPNPNAFKDLMFAQYVVEESLPIDMIVLAVNFRTFSPTTPHVIFETNPSHAQRVIDLYHVQPDFPVVARETHSFWAERSIIAGWIRDQGLSLAWLLMQRDRDDLTPRVMSELADLDTLRPITQPDILPAFAQFAAQTRTPVLIVVMPAPFERNVFSEWLQQEAQRVKLPLLDCSHVFTYPGSFQDYTHIMAVMHIPLTQILVAHLTDASMINVGPGLPLHGLTANQDAAHCKVS